MTKTTIKMIISCLGIAVGLAVFICGILTVGEVLGGDTASPSDAPYGYDSGYAEFGADFYTYVANNAAEAASVSRTTAYNLNDIAELLKNFCGIFLMGFGLMVSLRFGLVLCEYLKLPAPQRTRMTFPHRRQMSTAATSENKSVITDKRVCCL